ncbi:MAG: hypothetical protein CSB55_05440 [Candidatus Cloacimonadota bacterium]|nr:MAG: hypothetical protein CSB55_05440 [Candidatus Cloacimonadota bacterium]
MNKIKMTLKLFKPSKLEKGFFSLFLLMTIFLTVYRLLFFIKYKPEFAGVELNVILKAFFLGLRFDVSILGFILAPVVLFGSMPWIGLEFHRFSRRFWATFSALFFGAVTIGHIVNLEFFKEYNSHLNFTAIEYANNGGLIVYTIWRESPVIRYILLAAAFIFIFTFLQNKIFKSIKFDSWRIPGRIFYFILTGGLLFLGIRGRTKEGVMNWGLAFFSSDNMVNQLTLNPIYNLSKDIYYTQKNKRHDIKNKLQYFKSNREAIDFTVKEIVAPTDSLIDPEYPFYRMTDFGEEKQYNVVVLLMETMSAELTGILGGKHNLTPNFDRLSKEGILFNNFYTNGQRSNRAVSSSMCSYPVLAGKSILLQIEGQQPMPSVPGILKKRGYSTTFLYGGDISFDNMKGFLRSKGVDNFISEEDFPHKYKLNKWGVPDHLVFDRLLEVMDNSIGKPFFAMLFSLTNHEPFDVPDNIDFGHIDTGEPLNKHYNTFKYTDWAIGRFFEEVKKRDYFKNTIFVIFGDHGKSYHHDLAFDYRISHVPCLWYAPEIIGSSPVNERLSSQIDIAPSLFSLLGGKFPHSFFGRNMLKEPAEPVVITKYSQMGIIEDSLYYYAKIGEPGKLAKYNKFPAEDISLLHKEKLKEMRKYLYGISQAAYDVYKSKKIAPRQ